MFFDRGKNESLVSPHLVTSTDAKEVHYKSVLVTKEMPLLYTKNLTYCVGVGFKQYAEDKSIDRIGLYHSVSEHGSQCSDVKFIETALKTKSLTLKEEQIGENFVRAVYEFLKPVSDSKKIEVILHFNKACINMYELDFDAVHETLKAVWKYLHPSDKSDIQFAIKAQTGGSTFAISNQKDEVQNDLIAKAVCYRIVTYAKRMSRMMHHQCTDIIDQAEKGKYSWQVAAEKIHEQAKNIPLYDKNNKIYHEITDFLQDLKDAGLIKLHENHQLSRSIKMS